MWIRKIICLAFFICVTACTQVRSSNLPEGITTLKGIDHSGLQSPIWSHDGKRIAASYVIEAMPDIAGFFGPESRHDVVIIDTETWEASILVSEKWGNLVAESWLPDSRSFAMFWSDGPDGNGIYLFEINDTKPIYLSKSGELSPDFSKFAVFDDTYIKITDIHTQDIKDFSVPINGKWGVYDWSPNMEQLVLIYREHEKEHFNDIYFLDLNSGSFSQFTTDKTYIKSSPVISPDGQLIAYQRGHFNGHDIKFELFISRFDQNCGWTVPLDDIYYFAWSPDSQSMFLIGLEGVYLADLNVLFGSSFSNGNQCP